MPLFSETRSATAAAAVWFVLACAAVVGITEIASHGRAAAQDATQYLPIRPTPSADPANLSNADKPSAGAEAVIRQVSDQRSPQSP